MTAQPLPSPGLFFYFNDRHAHCVLSFQRFISAPVGIAIFKQQTVIDVFMVHGEQAVIDAVPALRQAKPRHTVVVHPGLRRLLFRGVAAVGFKTGRFPVKPGGRRPICIRVSRCSLPAR